jgi:hypothetical protein
MEFVAATRLLSSEITNCRFIVAGAPLFSGPEYLEKVKSASCDLAIQVPRMAGRHRGRVLPTGSSGGSFLR